MKLLSNKNRRIIWVRVYFCNQLNKEILIGCFDKKELAKLRPEYFGWMEYRGVAPFIEMNPEDEIKPNGHDQVKGPEMDENEF